MRRITILFNVAKACIIFLSFAVVGALVLARVEGVGFQESLYKVILLMATVSAYEPVTTSFGKFFSLFVLAVGMGVIFYIAISMGRLIIESDIRNIVRGLYPVKRRLKNHYIVCGFGRFGRNVVETLLEEKQPCVVIEKDVTKVRAVPPKVEVIQGDALDEVTLKRARIDSAKGLIAALADDASDLYLLLTAKELNPNLILATRAYEHAAVSRLRAAGARIVVLPEVVGGKRLARLVLDYEKGLREKVE